MSLDVWLVAPPEPGARRKAFRRRVAALEWDGYYEFLSRFWPASSSTGRIIDLYDTTHFDGANLDQLRAALIQAGMKAEAQPFRWREHIGTQTHPVQKELQATVVRSRLASLIGDLLAAVDEAKTRRGRLVFEGD